MEKLELKILQHIINGVEVEILNYKSDYVGIRYAKANGYYYLNGCLHITYEGGSTGKSLKEIKLLLRPLSDLTEKEANFMWFDIISTDNDCFNQDDFYECVELKSIEFLPIMVYPYLLSKHFDVFGLIEKGLAIDINTLEK